MRPCGPGCDPPAAFLRFRSSGRSCSRPAPPVRSNHGIAGRIGESHGKMCDETVLAPPSVVASRHRIAAATISSFPAGFAATASAVDSPAASRRGINYGRCRRCRLPPVKFSPSPCDSGRASSSQFLRRQTAPAHPSPESLTPRSRQFINTHKEGVVSLPLHHARSSSCRFCRRQPSQLIL